MPASAVAPSARASRFSAWLQACWWQRRAGAATWLLAPLAGLYRLLAALQRWTAGAAWRAPCPVVVVGNLVVGGAGKTPTVIALVRALQAQGYRPGVVSRGYGRRSQGTQDVARALDAGEAGDEPWLIHRATGVPVFVAESRVAAARALLERHPDTDLLIADDGLQHHALGRDAEVWVFDERGVGNGWLLPAGPLRQPLPQAVPPQALVLYNAPKPSTALPGALAQRRLAGALPLAAWQAGEVMDSEALQALARASAEPAAPLPALAGIASPQRFFTMLRDAGLRITEWPLADHAPLDPPPWPAGTPALLCTEKDAAKLNLAACGATQVWVVGLDFRLPTHFVAALRQRIAPPRSP